MEIEIKQKVNVPLSPWCGNCSRKDVERITDQAVCTIFNRYLFLHRGNFLKCRECYMNLYDQIEQEA